MELNYNFWKNRSVFITGHTGFKGGWMTLWLSNLGAKVSGYSLDAPTTPNFFTETNLKEKIKNSTIGDIKNFSALKTSMMHAKPSIVIHMAAQPLVSKGYKEPMETYATNVLGTINLLEAVRQIDTVEAIVNITSDKCYKNNEQLIPYQENDTLGGYDPYSSSKACVELVSETYKNSFLKDKGIKIATVRAGNVIGGGDWADDRLIPDLLRCTNTGKKLYVRFPNAIRPWQHVLEPLSGYLLLAEKLVNNGQDFAEAWNFGPKIDNPKPVSWIIDYLCRKIPKVDWEVDKSEKPHEANLLLLDSSKARSMLNWEPHWSLETTLDKIVEWHQAWKKNKKMDEISISQINSYYN